MSQNSKRGQTTWRLIDSFSCSPSFNMALDEAIAEGVRNGDCPPTLRFYEWNQPAVTLGYFQKASSVDLSYCLEKNIPVVRRLTGGRAVLHGSDLTYSFSTPTSRLFGACTLDNYAAISRAFLIGLQYIGLPIVVKKRPAERNELKNPSCFSSVSFSEMTMNAKKIIGSAQKRWQDGLLQQGSILIELNEAMLCRLFRLEHCRDVGQIKDVLPIIDSQTLKYALQQGFEQAFHIKFIQTEPEQSELSLAHELQRLKYESENWNLWR
jgi:lipoate-protein ligase A